VRAAAVAVKLQIAVKVNSIGISIAEREREGESFRSELDDCQSRTVPCDRNSSRISPLIGGSADTARRQEGVNRNYRRNHRWNIRAPR